MDNDVSRVSVKVITAGLFINLFLAAFKLLSGIYGHSRTMVADSVNHMGDVLSDIALLIGVKFWTKPPDATHPFGHRRIETFIALLIGLSIAATAVYIAYDAVTSFGTKHESAPKIIALVAALCGMVIKEFAFRFTDKAGRKLKSPAILAKALDHRSDAIEAVPVSAAVAASIFFPQYAFIDHIGALVVSAFILYISLRVIIPSLAELTDMGASKDICEKVSEICLSVKGVKGMHKLQTRRIGSLWSINVHIQVKGSLTVTEGHKISGAVKYALLNSDMDIIEAHIHVEPGSATRESGK